MTKNITDKDREIFMKKVYSKIPEDQKYTCSDQAYWCYEYARKESSAEFEKLKKELEWAVDIAYFWVDNISDKQKCVDLEYKYKLEIDHSYDNG